MRVFFLFVVRIDHLTLIRFGLVRSGNPWYMITGCLHQHNIWKTVVVIDLGSSRSILNQNKLLGQNVNFEQNWRTKSGFSSFAICCFTRYHITTLFRSKWKPHRFSRMVRVFRETSPVSCVKNENCTYYEYIFAGKNTLLTTQK
jgi:hypothetical protein